MSAPFRVKYTTDDMVIKAINESIEEWQVKHREDIKLKQGLHSFSIFSRTNPVPAPKEDNSQDVRQDTHLKR